MSTPNNLLALTLPLFKQTFEVQSLLASSASISPPLSDYIGQTVITITKNKEELILINKLRNAPKIILKRFHLQTRIITQITTTFEPPSEEERETIGANNDRIAFDTTGDMILGLRRINAAHLLHDDRFLVLLPSSHAHLIFVVDLHTNEWRMVKTSEQGAYPQLFAATPVAVGAEFVLFGGNVAPMGYSSELMWKLCLSTMTWRSLSHPSAPKEFKSYGATTSATDPLHLYFFGGRFHNKSTNTVKRLNTTTGAMNTLTSSTDDEDEIPSKKDGGACTIIDDVMYVYGGVDNFFMEATDELHCFNLVDKTWKNLSTNVKWNVLIGNARASPGPTSHAVMVNDGSAVYLADNSTSSLFSFHVKKKHNIKEQLHLQLQEARNEFTDAVIQFS